MANLRAEPCMRPPPKEQHDTAKAPAQSVNSYDLLRRLKLHGIKRQKVPKIYGLKKHQKSHSLACKKSSRFWNTTRTLM